MNYWKNKLQKITTVTLLGLIGQIENLIFPKRLRTFLQFFHLENYNYYLENREIKCILNGLFNDSNLSA